MPIGKNTTSAGASLAALGGEDVLRATVIEDYRPAGRTLARAGEQVRLLDGDGGSPAVAIYRPGKRYARFIPRRYLKVEGVD